MGKRVVIRRYKCKKMEVITLAINKMMNEKMMEVLLKCGSKYGFDGKEAYNWSIKECGVKKVKVGKVGKVVEDENKAEDLISSLMRSEVKSVVESGVDSVEDDVSVTNSC